ncbi:uncharacterized protein H6S33_004736 [Morchella sextelata]|uniref:uncharacterized protein n=1 Tax=Morchella sextelata TaxID=1174677 RepID=UPI001D053DAA|nr:uncharacterized protein H6S33_004736 [Morchella sextelata]KAH0605514.1 hypothetical protein H6S33_004736 [Morchella sextelata]
MWAAMFSRKKPAAAPVEVRAIEVTATTTTTTTTAGPDRAAPENEKPAQGKTTTTTTATTTSEPRESTAATTTSTSTSTPTPPTTTSSDKDPKVRIKSEPTSRASTPASTTTRPKRPRTSDSHPSTTSPHLRKRTRHSLGPSTSTRSPLVRAPRNPSTTTPPAVKSESRTPPKQLPTPATSITESITTLTLLSPAPAKPKRRSRLSLPVEDGSSVVSTTSEQETDELRREGFSNDEATLFQRIRRRGLEPLMPAHWQVDFATMPDNLFQQGPDDSAVIEGIAPEGTFAATAAFQAMVNLGAGVRSKLETRREVEGRILSVLRRYICWAVEDAALDNKHIEPMIAISCSQERGAEHCEQRMDKKLHDLAAEYRAEEARLIAAGHDVDSGFPSTVYGMAVAGCVVALITLDARNRQAPTRTLLVVDFSDVTLDFWNAVGVAIFVIAARDDEVLRLQWYNEAGMEKPKRKDGAMAWMGRVKIKKLNDDDDEDK